MNMINQILDFIIKLSIVSGITLLVYFYCKILILDRKIENLNRKFEKDRNDKRGQGRGITEPIINSQIEKLEKDKNESVSPLERERSRLLSIIPFLK